VGPRTIALVLGLLAAVGALGALPVPLTLYGEEDPPLQMTGSDGKPTGLVVELVQEIERRTGATDTIELVPWTRGYEAVQTRPNLLLFSMARTAERNSLFQWIGPTLEFSYSFIGRADSSVVIHSLEDARALKAIGVYKDDARDAFLTKQGFTNLDRAVDNVMNVRKLMSGRIEAYAGTTDSWPEVETAGFPPSAVRQLFVFARVQLYLAASLGTPATTVRLWNQTLDAMKTDGTFQKIYAKYYPGRALPGPAITSF
jgi:polar amino acid transport system substrate-binding protein